MKKFLTFIKPIIQFAGILIIGATIILTTNFIVNKNKVPEIQIVDKVVEKEVVLKTPECFGGFDEFNNLLNKGQFVKLVDGKYSYAFKGRFVNELSVNVERSGAGIVACGYLYIKSSVGNRKLDDVSESIYVNPQKFGGHILRSKTLEIKEPIKNKTEVLLPLSEIAYLPHVPYDPRSQNYKMANWVNLLNVDGVTNFDIALSSLYKSGYIDEISIAYKCWNPETGKETSDCQLGVVNN
jgi:hypothetical protein